MRQNIAMKSKGWCYYLVAFMPVLMKFTNVFSCCVGDEHVFTSILVRCRKCAAIVRFPFFSAGPRRSAVKIAHHDMTTKSRPRPTAVLLTATGMLRELLARELDETL